MGNKYTKINLENKCDLLINKDILVKPYKCFKNNGYYYIYFNLNKIKDLNKMNNIHLDLSWLKNNQSFHEIIEYIFYPNQSKVIKIKNKSFIEYSILSNNNLVNIRLGKPNHLLFRYPFTSS